MCSTFLCCFLFGGFTGLILANSSMDLMYHDTYFVIGHFHYVLSVAAALGLLIFTIPLVSVCFDNILLNKEKISKFCLSLLVSLNILFLPQHIIGIEGHPRRIYLSPEIYLGVTNISNIGLFNIILICIFI